MFIVTRDYIENYTGDDGDNVVTPIDCMWIFVNDFDKEIKAPLKSIESGLDEYGQVTFNGLKILCPYQFRLYDGDDNLYYEGYYNGLENDEEDAFEPLDWGQSFAGCTTLRYLENGEWKEL